MGRWSAGMAAVLLATGAHAAIYKWVDGQGRVHYGDRPPGGNAAEMDVPASPRPGAAPDAAERLEKQRRLLRAYDEERRRREERAARDRLRAADLERRCEAARERLRLYRDAGYLFRKDALGERVILSDSERRAEEAELERTIADHCE